MSKHALIWIVSVKISVACLVSSLAGRLPLSLDRFRIPPGQPSSALDLLRAPGGIGANPETRWGFGIRQGIVMDFLFPTALYFFLQAPRPFVGLA